MTDPANPAAPKPRKTAAVRKSAETAIATTGKTARGLARRAEAGIEASPVAVLVGGAALGALAGAFVPRTARETALLGAAGKRLTDTARGAVDAARDTAKAEFDVLGLSRDAARSQMSTVLQGVVGALAAAGAAALAGRSEPAEPATTAEPTTSPRKPTRPKTTK